VAASGGRHLLGASGGDSDAGRKALRGGRGHESRSSRRRQPCRQPKAAGEYPGGVSRMGGMDRDTMGSQGDSSRLAGGSRRLMRGGAAPRGGS
jgi:hypothetical protein